MEVLLLFVALLQGELPRNSPATSTMRTGQAGGAGDGGAAPAKSPCAQQPTPPAEWGRVKPCWHGLSPGQDPAALRFVRPPAQRRCGGKKAARAGSLQTPKVTAGCLLLTAAPDASLRAGGSGLWELCPRRSRTPCSGGSGRVFPPAQPVMGHSRKVTYRVQNERWPFGARYHISAAPSPPLTLRHGADFARGGPACL